LDSNIDALSKLDFTNDELTAIEQVLTGNYIKVVKAG